MAAAMTTAAQSRLALALQSSNTSQLKSPGAAPQFLRVRLQKTGVECRTQVFRGHGQGNVFV